MTKHLEAIYAKNGMGIVAAVLKGSMDGKKRSRIVAALVEADLDIVTGDTLEVASLFNERVIIEEKTLFTKEEEARNKEKLEAEIQSFFELHPQARLVVLRDSLGELTNEDYINKKKFNHIFEILNRTLQKDFEEKAGMEEEALLPREEEPTPFDGEEETPDKKLVEGTISINPESGEMKIERKRKSKKR